MSSSTDSRTSYSVEEDPSIKEYEVDSSDTSSHQTIPVPTPVAPPLTYRGPVTRVTPRKSIPPPRRINLGSDQPGTSAAPHLAVTNARKIYQLESEIRNARIRGDIQQKFLDSLADQLGMMSYYNTANGEAARAAGEMARRTLFMCQILGILVLLLAIALVWAVLSRA